MTMSKKKTYITPAMQVMGVEPELPMAYSGYNVDNKYGGGIKGSRKDEDWDEDSWGLND